jgi:choline-phosphate cytidylyltransferase
MTTVITFGTFDVFHVGHLRMIERAAALGDRLVVGVSADALNLRKKGREPIFSEAERVEIVAALKPVSGSSSRRAWSSSATTSCGTALTCW